MVIRPEADRFDWSTVAVALLVIIFLVLLAYAVWRADRIDAAPRSGVGAGVTTRDGSSRIGRPLNGW
jgi:predicted small integral membrane protein